MADLPLLGDELRRRLALERDRQLGIDPGAGNDRGYAFNQWLPLSTNKVGSASWVQQGADPKPAVPEALQGGLLGGADLLDSPRTGKLTPEALGSLLTGSTMTGGLLAPRGSLASGGSIKAYHGSPHDFDRFDASKIGMGEGAQAYGHGLYFAENEGVARSYKTAGLGPQQSALQFEGQNVINLPREQFEALPDLTRKALVFAKDDANIAQAVQNATAQGRADIADEIMRLHFGGKLNQSVASSGHMYEVNIKADPQKFLDWDKPLSGQSGDVQKALAENFPARSGLKPEWSGAQLYESSRVVPGQHRDPALASAVLNQAGIPGIKYLDQGSRGSGTGTSNYVVFPTQEEIIQILRKYGLAAPSPVVPGVQGVQTTPGLLSDQQSEIPIKDRVY